MWLPGFTAIICVILLCNYTAVLMFKRKYHSWHFVSSLFCLLSIPPFSLFHSKSVRKKKMRTSIPNSGSLEASVSEHIRTYDTSWSTKPFINNMVYFYLRTLFDLFKLMLLQVHKMLAFATLLPSWNFWWIYSQHLTQILYLDLTFTLIFLGIKKKHFDFPTWLSRSQSLFWIW